jgi:chemotaxis protein histidine kinase CheA
MDLVHDDLIAKMSGSVDSLTAACKLYLDELRAMSFSFAPKIEDVISVLEDTISRLKLVTHHKSSPEQIKIFYDKVLEFSQFFSQKGDYRVSLVLNALLLKSVCHAGVDLTHSVRQILRGLEELMLGRTDIDVEGVNGHLYLFLQTIKHTSAIADFTQLVTMRDVFPDLLEDFYHIFWDQLVAKVDHLELMDGKELLADSDSDQASKDGPGTSDESRKISTETVKVDSRYLNQFTRNVESLIMYRNYLDNLESEIRLYLPNALAADLKYGLHEVGESISSLYKSLLLIRRAKASVLLNRLPKQIRQLGIELGKDVTAELIGIDTEVDRNLLSMLQEPLIHLLRNSMDHGIEPPVLRQELGKPTQGKICIKAQTMDSSFILTVEDDGRGIDTKMILHKARAKGLARMDTEYSEAEIYEFLFQSGFSTAETVTNVSGRGVGLDSVLHAVKRTGGKIEVFSKLGEGSIFSLIVPENQAVKTARLILVVCSGQRFAIRESEVLEIMDSKKLGDGLSADGIAIYRESVISYLNLAFLLGLKVEFNLATFRAAIIVKKEMSKFAIIVDSIVQTLDAVIEPFVDSRLNQNHYFEGTIAIGSKAPILVLNLETIAESYCNKADRPEEFKMA